MSTRYQTTIAVSAYLALCGSAARADVFNMPTGQTSLQFVTVENVGNPGEWTGQSYGGYGADRLCGGVNYTYKMGSYEVTYGQYGAFLNAVAKTDTYGLYSPNLWTSLYGYGIKRNGASGNYTYSVAADQLNKPIRFVSWGDAVRFANWLTNGQPTTGVQDNTTTEDGSYCLNGATSNADLMAVVRKADARYVIPTEDEWYKAAYHKNDGVTGNYWDYPTSSNTINHTMANYDWYVHDTTAVGFYGNNSSPYGTYDQGGNVWEWNESILLGSYRAVRGGSFGYIDGSMTSMNWTDDYPTVEYADFGFRVAEVPEPASLILFVAGGLMTIRRKRSLM